MVAVQEIAHPLRIAAVVERQRQGTDVKISMTGTIVKINDATVAKTDIETSNGVIHVIDTVILPS